MMNPKNRRALNERRTVCTFQSTTRLNPRQEPRNFNTNYKEIEMTISKITEKNQTKIPKVVQPDEKSNKGADASQDVKAKEKLTKNNKEAKMADTKEKSKKQAKIKNPETSTVKEGELAPNVTMDPQTKEQLDLNLMEDPVAVSIISVPTDDDEGEFLEDPEAVKALREFIDENKSKDVEALKDAELLKIGTEIASSFNKKISLKEALTLAALTKNSILYGMSLIILKDCIKATGQNWIYYYKNHFIPSTYSSAIKYMKLARIPNIIRYSFLGLERLEKIHTAIKEDYDMADSDPYGEFFNDSSILIDFHDCDLENFKYDIDAAVANTRINNFFKEMNKDISDENQVKNVVDAGLIEDLIRKDKKIEAGLMMDLFLYTKGGANPNVLLEESLKGDRTTLKLIKKDLTAAKTIEGFPKLISELKSKVKYLTDNKALVKEITQEHVADLEAQVFDLRQLFDKENKSK